MLTPAQSRPDVFGAATTLTRRHALGFGSAAVMSVLVSGQALAQGASPSVADLMAEGPLPDVWQGSAIAPVTIIEYASMTCTHCAAFHAGGYQALKSKYIDTGKVRFVLREFPLDALAAAGFMIARCAGDDKRNAMVDLLFAQQKGWAFVDKPVEALASLVRQTGMSRESFDTCLKDPALFGKVNQTRDRASEKFGINSTPTFFINGKREGGDMSAEAIDRVLAPLLKG